MADEAKPLLFHLIWILSVMLSLLFIFPLPLTNFVSIFSRSWRHNFFSQIHRFGFSSNILCGMILLKEILS